jgi:hypothetical protein
MSGIAVEIRGLNINFSECTGDFHGIAFIEGNATTGIAAVDVLPEPFWYQCRVLSD